ncbi:MAG: FGGY family carbohydrate kinase [Burkholderiaceae bacterium]|nr:FGGY family carbohydrate kinase [Burkholderiaceae bacterium]
MRTGLVGQAWACASGAMSRLKTPAAAASKDVMRMNESPGGRRRRLSLVSGCGSLRRVKPPAGRCGESAAQARATSIVGRDDRPTHAACRRAAADPMSRYVLALDQGTTSSRAIVFDRAGRPVASAQQEFRQIFPQPGWVEHDPLEIWSSQLLCAQQALQRAGAQAHDVAAIGVTNQRETVVLWERASGRPLANAIVWQDRRTAEPAPSCVRAASSPRSRRKTGLLLDPYFSATKIAWLLDSVPGARARAERGELAFGTVDTWLIWNLTGGALHVTDATNASRTLLLNIRHGRLGRRAAATCSACRARCCRSVRATQRRRSAQADGAVRCAIPIAGIAGDQQAALFGQACLTPGIAKNTYGTGCFMLMNTGTRAGRLANRLLDHGAWQLDDRQPHIRAGRQRLHRRRRGAVAA